ncbi:hypothetical protein [Pseudoxanthomonas sp. CF125]|uniref:hypothetical protein n=1 Tax=Pseudoxanthomonas sp. CF125 TaxID=1855303 RepID=UPI000884E671|nr:hypothetical protein [Pseudoxanthomonas sp. CF125]SDR06382.1 hypothetical protein SAMN05216569_2893 [Pseudoxanthomonas sp. CF125]
MAGGEKKTKRPPGRPKLPPGLKVDQFSIALSAPVRLGLEMLARHRRVSLSKAVEYCVASTLQSYQMDGETLPARMHVEVPEGYSSPDEAWAAKLLRSPGKRALWMPASLRTPEEEYFVRVVGLLKSDEERFDEDEKLFELSKKGFVQGVAEEELAQYWDDQMAKVGPVDF